jgi:lysophospholipid acyltransferase (LPLAT)-like uncharacterized protein
MYSLQTSLSGLLLSLSLKGLCCTFRLQKVGLSINDSHWTNSEPCILTFWHGDQLFMPWAYFDKGSITTRRSIFALISEHGDGRIAASALEWLGLASIAGSSTRGGKRALLQLKKKLDAGSHVAITPDGPKGPPRVAKEGVIKLASLTGAPILPITVAASKFWEIKSWDSMLVPKPFSKVLLYAGEPIQVEKDISREALNKQSLHLSEILNQLKSSALEILEEEVTSLSPAR